MHVADLEEVSEVFRGNADSKSANVQFSVSVPADLCCASRLYSASLNATTQRRRCRFWTGLGALQSCDSLAFQIFLHIHEIPAPLLAG